MKEINAILIWGTMLTSCGFYSPHRPNSSDSISTDSATKMGESISKYYSIANKPSVDTLYLCVADNSLHIGENTKLNVLIVNATCSAIQYGDEHYFEYYENNKWKRMKPLEDDAVLVWNTVGYELQPYTEEKRIYRMNKKLYDFKTGKYRIVLPVSYKGNEKLLIDSFHIVNDAIH